MDQERLENILTLIGEKIDKNILINCLAEIKPTEEINIWVGARPGRASKNDFPQQPNTIRIDVSSGSMKKIDGLAMKAFSPLLLGPVYDTDNNKYVTFENLWQYNKVFPQLGHWDPINKEPTAKWYEWRKNGMSKLKNGKGIRTPDEITKLKKNGLNTKPIGAWWQNTLLGYIESRKIIYVPKYIEAIKQIQEYAVLRRIVDKGSKLLIIELDGPPLDKFPNGMPVTRENIDNALHDEKYPYGHGYVIAELLAEI